MRSGRRVAGLNRARRGWTLILDDGEEITVRHRRRDDRREAGHPLAATAPDIDATDGVLCDAALRVVDTEDVVAAGTIARWPNLHTRRRRAAVGQWITALEQGGPRPARCSQGPTPSSRCPTCRASGRTSSACGSRSAARPPDGGRGRSITEMRPGRSDTARAGVLVGYHVDGAQVGLAAVNAPGPFTPMARAMLANAGSHGLLRTCHRTRGPGADRRPEEALARRSQLTVARGQQVDRRRGQPKQRATRRNLARRVARSAFALCVIRTWVAFRAPGLRSAERPWALRGAGGGDHARCVRRHPYAR